MMNDVACARAHLQRLHPFVFSKLRTPASTPVRNVAFFRGRNDASIVNHSAHMRDRIDTPAGCAKYGQRFATVEFVLANLRHNKRLARFTMRGGVKVDAQ